ncbi:MAG TPA: hypothetical protein PL004_04005 [Bacillota bacterium]|nr:hypothetical protein [Bacillota bacterium]
MIEWFCKLIKWQPERDNNYYFGLVLLILSIVSIAFYLIYDAFEPVSFLITFLLCGWGFVLLWKSDNDYRFAITQAKLEELEQEIQETRQYIVSMQLSSRYRRFSRSNRQ